MRKIESAPEWANEPLFAEGLKLFMAKELQPVINSINDRYLYWDKVKYQKNLGIDDPRVFWSVLKLSRTIHAKLVTFGSHKFMYNLTDLIQKGLHEFDLHIGGNLGSKSIIPEDDKKRYLISSIMEEAIASSQIEGAVTTRKKAKENAQKK